MDSASNPFSRGEAVDPADTDGNYPRVGNFNDRLGAGARQLETQDPDSVLKSDGIQKGSRKRRLLDHSRIVVQLPAFDFLLLGAFHESPTHSGRRHFPVL